MKFDSKIAVIKEKYPNLLEKMKDSDIQEVVEGVCERQWDVKKVKEWAKIVKFPAFQCSFLIHDLKFLIDGTEELECDI